MAGELLLLRFDGADGATTTVDSSDFARTITAVGDVELDTAEVNVGTASSFFPEDGGTSTGGGTHYWTFPASNDFDSTFWNGDWTLECRWRPEIDNQGRVYFLSWFSNANHYIDFYYNWAGGGTLPLSFGGPNTFAFRWRQGATNTAKGFESTNTFVPTINTWYKIRLEKTGNDFEFFVDGVKLGSTITETDQIISVEGVTGKVGSNGNSGSPNIALQGWLDHVIIYPGSLPVSAFDGTPVDGSNMCAYVEKGQVREMVDSVTGLDHLEGEAIKVTADGDVPRNAAGKEVTNSFTVSSGVITLAKKAAVIHAGLGYDGTIRLLKSNEGSGLGTAQSKMRRVYLAVLRLQKTLGLSLGIDEDHLDDLFENSQQTLFTGDKDKLPNTTWSDDTEFVIKQTKPVPAYVLAAIIRSELEEKL